MTFTTRDDERVEDLATGVRFALQYDDDALRDQIAPVERLRRLRGRLLVLARQSVEPVVDAPAAPEPADKRSAVDAPIPMVLHCPECRTRHIDVGEFATKVHHTHSCQSCGLTWRPSVVPTVGVQFLPGFKNDDGLAAAERPAAEPNMPEQWAWEEEGLIADVDSTVMLSLRDADTLNVESNTGDSADDDRIFAIPLACIELLTGRRLAAAERPREQHCDEHGCSLRECVDKRHYQPIAAVQRPAVERERIADAVEAWARIGASHPSEWARRIRRGDYRSVYDDGTPMPRLACASCAHGSPPGPDHATRCPSWSSLVAAERPHKLTWNGTEWVAPCGCRYHPDDDNGSHGGAPHVHLCDEHVASTIDPPCDPPWYSKVVDLLISARRKAQKRGAYDVWARIHYALLDMGATPPEPDDADDWKAGEHVSSLADAIAEVRATVSGVPEKSAAESALDDIAKLCGCPTWEYPGQVVRDVCLLIEQRGGPSISESLRSLKAAPASESKP